MATTFRRAAAHCAAALFFAVAIGHSPMVSAQDLNDEYDLYEAYDYGYQDDFTDYEDDWYYDYYEYSLGDYDWGYDYYSDYDYDADTFAWEEKDLFE